MTGPEMGGVLVAVNAFFMGLGTIAVQLWGSKKDRMNSALTADQMAKNAAEEVRKELQAELQQYRAENREQRAQHASDLAKFENDRREWLVALHEMEKQALEARAQAQVAEERARNAEVWAAELKRQIGALEARISEILGQKAA